MSPSGFLILDKPRGMTSRAALNRVQPWFQRGTKIGHAGTLDPLATGVLVIAVGQATRLIEYVQRMEKVYLATIRLGATSDTDDADGKVTPRAHPPRATQEEVQRALARFVGPIQQRPPAFSALKVEGRRAHALARRGESVDLAARTVAVYDIQTTRYDYPDLEITVRCGQGTYIRSLARDLGDALGCGGYIEALRRERIGLFSVAQAIGADVRPETLLPLESAVADLHGVTLSAEEIRRLAQGSALHFQGVKDDAGASEIAVFDADHRLRLITRRNREDGFLRPTKVFPLDCRL